MDFFGPTIKALVVSLHKDIFDTWKRAEKLRFYKKAQEVFVYESDYLSDFDEGENANLKDVEYAEFDVCLTYMDRQEKDRFIAGEDSGVRFNADYNRVRVQVELDAYQYLEGVERFTFGGEKFLAEDSWRKLGMFGEFQFYEVVLQKVV